MPVAAEPAVPNTKLVIVELPKECKAYFMDSTIWVSDSSFRVVSSDGRKSPIYPYNEAYKTREEAFVSVLEYFEKLYTSVA